MNQIPWHSLPRLNVYMTFLLIVFCPWYLLVSSFNPSSSFLSWLLDSEEVLVSLDDAHEVGVECEKDGGLKEYFEEVVFLLEFLVLFFCDSIADEDFFSLIDGRVVDDIPESNEED